jgi:hypothetical protein
MLILELFGLLFIAFIAFALGLYCGADAVATLVKKCAQSAGADLGWLKDELKARNLMYVLEKFEEK